MSKLELGDGNAAQCTDVHCAALPTYKSAAWLTEMGLVKSANFIQSRTQKFNDSNENKWLMVQQLILPVKNVDLLEVCMESSQRTGVDFKFAAVND